MRRPRRWGENKAGAQEAWLRQRGQGQSASASLSESEPPWGPALTPTPTGVCGVLGPTTPAVPPPLESSGAGRGLSHLEPCTRSLLAG